MSKVPDGASNAGQRVKIRGAVLLPGVVLVIALMVGFAQPIAPDTSVYLLQTRTLLEQGNRYIDSHDNKGPMMVWLTAPAVRGLGANARAAGWLRALAALGVAALTYKLIRRSGGRSRAFAFHFAALAAALPYSSVLWGDSLRPETYAVVLNAGILWLGTRKTGAAALAAGILAGMVIFLKSILVIPALAMLAGWLILEWRQQRKLPVAAALRMAVGAMLTATLILGWLAWRDSIPDFYRQTLEWPAEYRKTVERTELQGHSTLTARLLALYKASDDPGRLWLYPLKVPITLLRSGVWPLVLLVAWLMWQRRFPRDRCAMLALCWMLGVLLELGLEHRRWPYPAAGLLPPILLWLALAPLGDRREPARLLAVWLASGILLGGLAVEAARLLPARWRGAPLSSYEALARELGPRYRAGETLLVMDNNYALHLLLPAPRPPRILSVHAAMVNPGERELLRREIARNPPCWIAGKEPAHTGLRFGGVAGGAVSVEERRGELFLSGPYAAPIASKTAWARRLDPAPSAP